MNPSASYFDPTGYSGGGYNNPCYTSYADPSGSPGYGIDSSAAAAGGGYYSEDGIYIPAVGSQDDSYHVEEQWNEPVDLAATTEPGSYYPVSRLQSSLLFGVPISAIAYDLSFDAIYTATVTKSSASSSSSSSSSNHHPQQRRFCSQRSTTMVTHNLSDGMLYSAVEGHPEAPSKVLNAIYSTIYGHAQPSAPNKAIPTHAFTPAYGTTDPALPDISAVGGGGGGGNFQLGVTHMIPLQEGTVASVSPAGVRLHALGGMQLADQPIEGMLAASSHPSSLSTNSQQHHQISHLTVAGMALRSNHHRAHSNNNNNNGSEKHHLHCLDVWQGLRIVTSHTLDRKNTTQQQTDIAVTGLATSHSRGCVVAGCSDGFLRLVDDRNRDIAKIKSHTGGVAAVTVSDDGTLVATTGYGSTTPVRRSGTPLYGYPDPTIHINDIRYLGRGGFPHTFAGLNGGPLHLAFLPESEGQESNRLLVASSQVGGGCQVMVPFQDAALNKFILPRLGRSESINTLCVADDKLALGTNKGNLLQYCLAGFQHPNAALPMDVSTRGGMFVPSPGSGVLSSAVHARPKTVEKQPLVMPPFEPPPPVVSLDASVLLKDDPTTRIGMNDRIKSIFGAYILTVDPSVSSIGDPSDRSFTSFGPLAANPLVAQCRFKVSPTLARKESHSMDFVQTIPTSELDVDIFDDHRPTKVKDREKKKSEPSKNPNKLIYNNKLFKVCYAESFNRSKRYERQSRRYGKASASDDSDDEGDLISIPYRYRLALRPTHKSAASFSHSDFNQSGTIPGFDYPITMPNAFVPPVLLLLYFIPEVREAALKNQLGQALLSPRDYGLVTELGYLFHRIDTLARCSTLFPSNEGSSVMTRIEAWAPMSFISYLSTMPEADRFQILDGSPAAVDAPRRPEAFYRFLMYQLDNEINRGRSNGLLDSLGGVEFVSINEFISGSGPPSKSTTRHLTVELSYDHFFGADYKSDKKPCFGDVLQFNLCRANRLRAWSQSSKSYETIVQRKIVTSLPSILSLSAACAGRKESEGLALWKDATGDNNHWLPEMIEVEIEDNGSVIVRELVHDEKSGSDSWKECTGTGPIPASVSTVVKESTQGGSPRKRRYRLEAVVSMIRDDLDRACPEEVRAADSEGPFGHHVLHARVSKEMKKRIIQQQRNRIKTYLSTDHGDIATDLTLVGRAADKEVLQKRFEDTEKRLAALDEKSETGNGWVLVNGYVVSDTVIEDARAFHVKFKEPSLVVFRALDDFDAPKTSASKGKAKYRLDECSDVTIPPDVIRTSSITNMAKSPYASNQRPAVLPGNGDLVAFDGEFVAVAEEEATLTNTGAKVTVRETRHALARISVIDGRPGSAGSVIFDDHVLPNEQVTDYLTRFSGIVAQDLSPKHSRHHLITARAAYLKLRCLVERGCIFVGHGLQQDFWTANVAVPASQIIDTVDIYHKPAQRYISLRFLTNFVLKRDMQQDVHDSVDDALTAFELYKKAIELKKSGDFERVLDELYEYGRKHDWRLGVDGDDDPP